MSATGLHVAAPLVALVVAAAVTRWLASPSSRLRVLDEPGHRSLHDRPTPRTGGLGVLAGVVVGSLMLMRIDGFGGPIVWLAAAAIVVVSFVDDVRDLAAAPRFVVHLGAAIAVASSGLAPERLVLPGAVVALPQALAFVLTVGYVLWAINLYNFMDGMDGLAGGMAVIGFGTLAFLLENTQLTTFLAGPARVLAGAAAGFLLFNFPPARIFLGDVGSCTLGFALAVLTLAADGAGPIPLWLSLVVFAPFVADATVTLITRAARGEKVWEAHREHHYQRLVRAGWSHRRTVLAAYGLMLVCAGAAVVAHLADDAAVDLAVAGVVLALLVAAGYAVRRATPRKG